VDAEKGDKFLIDTSSSKLRNLYADRATRIFDERAKLFASVAVDHIDIWTDRPYINELRKFFKMRKRRL
jgi:hypothetical protein